MARRRILLSPSELLYQELYRAAAERNTAPATFALELIERGLASSSSSELSGSAQRRLYDWLEPRLDRLRQQGDWASDITVTIFDQIRDGAHDLYEAAVAEVGRDRLNRDIGRTIKERLHACVLTEGGKPRRIKVPRARRSLVQLATLLEPRPPRELAGE